MDKGDGGSRCVGKQVERDRDSEGLGDRSGIKRLNGN